MSSTTQHDPLEVVIVGAGVAGLETLMALRSLAGSRVRITLVAPESEFVYRPLSVAEPFGIDSVHRYPLDRIAHDFGATHLKDELTWVGPGSQRLFLASGDELGYDALVIALGAHPYAAWPHVPTFRGPRDVEMVRGMVDDVVAGNAQSVAFVVPSGVSWSFPLYELALLTASRAQAAGQSVDIGFFTPERAPLEVFGDEASDEIGRVLEDAGVQVTTNASVEVTADSEVIVSGAPQASRRFDRVIALPRLDGPAPRGLPCDDDGFLPVDAHGLVRRVQHIYAAGDGTDFPVKQGGIATQQADAVAEVIAKRAGARVDPRPLRPVLRGRLLANGSSRYLRADLHPRDGGMSEASTEASWWPAGKIVGTHLSPYLAALDAQPAVGS